MTVRGVVPVAASCSAGVSLCCAHTATVAGNPYDTVLPRQAGLIHPSDRDLGLETTWCVSVLLMIRIAAGFLCFAIRIAASCLCFAYEYSCTSNTLPFFHHNVVVSVFWTSRGHRGSSLIPAQHMPSSFLSDRGSSIPIGRRFFIDFSLGGVPCAPCVPVFFRGV